MTDTKVLSGLCIGGPRAGQYQDAIYSPIRVPEIPETNWFPQPNQAVDEPVEYKVTHYYHVVGLRGDVKMDFWAHESIADESLEPTVSDVFHVLFRIYMEASND